MGDARVCIAIRNERHAREAIQRVEAIVAS